MHQGEFFHHTVPAAMITFTRAVHLLPIFFPILIVVTILTPYIIAVSLDHVYPFLPCISKTAGFEPEGSIFGFLMFLVALIGLLTIFARYLQLKGFSQQRFEANVYTRWNGSTQFLCYLVFHVSLALFWWQIFVLLYHKWVPRLSDNLMSCWCMYCPLFGSWTR